MTEVIPGSKRERGWRGRRGQELALRERDRTGASRRSPPAAVARSARSDRAVRRWWYLPNVPPFRYRWRLAVLVCAPLMSSPFLASACSGSGEATAHSDAGTPAPGALDGSVEPDAFAPPEDAAGNGGGALDAGLDDAGWTTFPGLPGTDGGYARAIYVDSVNGSDTNTGDSPSQALQHVSNTSKLHDLLSAADAGGGIVVLLKPGSSWPAEQLWIPTGGTADYPLLVTGEGWPDDAGTTARPQVGGGIRVIGNDLNHVAMDGLAVGPYPDGGTFSSYGIDISVPGGTDYLVEDCLITDYYNLIAVAGTHTQPVTNLRVRRSYLFGAYGTGPVVAFDGNDIVGALFEENFFDYNGGPDGDYLNPVLEAPYTNVLAHDIYFADDGTSVIAYDVTLRRNLFSRTLESVKGPYTGSMDDNLFYDYSSGGYIGTWGAVFSNNVLLNGGGFSASLDNAHDPNTDAGAVTLFCTNLQYNEGSPYQGGGFAASTIGDSIIGVNLDYVGNIIDGFDQAFQLHDDDCFGYRFTSNLIQADKLFEFYGPWPQPQCPLVAAGNVYHSPMGPGAAGSDGYGLEVNPGDGGPTTYQDYAAMEAFLREDGGAYEDASLAFADPTRDIASYLVATALAPASPAPTLLDYLALLRSQAQTAHQWNPALSVTAVNAYLRAGHAMAERPFAYGSACP
jgi:hypothetical protein